MNEKQAIVFIAKKVKKEGGYTKCALALGVTRYAIMSALKGRQNVLPNYLLAWAGLAIIVKTAYIKIGVK